MTDYRASHRYAKITARKARRAVDLVRGLPVNQALTVLEHNTRRSAFLVRKVVRSAVANAEQAGDVDLNELRVVEARVDEGPLLGGYMRWRPSARGRAMPYRKRTSHIHIRLGPPAPAGEPRGKPRGDEPGTAAEPQTKAPASADATKES